MDTRVQKTGELHWTPLQPYALILSEILAHSQKLSFERSLRCPSGHV